MSIENNSETPEAAPSVAASDTAPAPRAGMRKRLRMASAGAAILGVLLVGAGAGAVAMNAIHPRDQQTLLPPVAITQMTDGTLVAVKGEVAEVYGNKFVIGDATGRALVDTGRGGEDKVLVKPGEQVTAQGRFDGGFVRASMVVHADGKVDELRAPPPRHDHGPGGPGPKGFDRPGGPGEPGVPPREAPPQP